MGLLTATEVARRLGKTDKTIRAWIKSGALSAVHISKTQLGIREEDMYRLAAHKGIDVQQEPSPGDDTLAGLAEDVGERIARLEQEIAALRNEITLLKSERGHPLERATTSVEHAHVSRHVETATRPQKSAVEPLNGIPEHTVLMRAFAQEHGVNPRTMLDHVTKGIAGDLLEVIERPKPNRPRETERLLTPAMQEQAIAFWQRHNVAYTPCSACPHSQDVAEH